MTSQTSFRIPLYEAGSEGAAYRIQNLGYNDLQRQHIVQQEDRSLCAQADLVSVTHGRYDSEPATLIVVDFSFMGSRTGGRRYKSVMIDVAFSRDGRRPGSRDDPVIRQIAPAGSFILDRGIHTIERRLQHRASTGLSGFELTSGYSRTLSGDRPCGTVLYGWRRVEGRNRGNQNAVRWELAENDFAQSGIPSSLRTAIIVEPRTTERFQAWVTIKAEVDIRYSAKAYFGRRMVDPVYFGSISERRDLGPRLNDVDPDDLSTCNLEAIGAVNSN